MSLQDAQKALAMVQRAKARGRAADITFTLRIEGEYDPNEGETSLTLEWSGLAVVLPVSAQGDHTFEQGTMIESTHRALLIPALGLEHEPRPGDTVTLPDGSIGALLGCTPLNPDVANPI